MPACTRQQGSGGRTCQGTRVADIIDALRGHRAQRSIFDSKADPDEIGDNYGFQVVDDVIHGASRECHYRRSACVFVCQSIGLERKEHGNILRYSVTHLWYLRYSPPPIIGLTCFTASTTV